MVRDLRIKFIDLNLYRKKKLMAISQGGSYGAEFFTNRFIDRVLLRSNSIQFKSNSFLGVSLSSSEGASCL
jgi:hypothetical protein